ncbi:FAD-binding oxidoreductase [Marichromatium bheemlicum]|uniref:FAD-binding oxidoreductase n=1 Tax=Marichromatium bheemlicum TaxID=365339 RepID=A0ABX1I858_9GAMM|nr:FAD-binding oxidoreductase [Marichromatium bheemlicum]NKN33361.1 FAD-binding oxidoreductase [Marichromatium bheemlicum]
MSETAGLAAALGDWRALLGEQRVLVGEAVHSRYGLDTTGTQRQIVAALLVEQADQVAPLVAVAKRYRLSLYPISTGRNWGYGSALPVRDGCVIVDLGRLQRILDFDPELGVVTLEPGVTQAMLADFLDRHAYPFLVPVTGAGPHCSLIGNALERGYGITPHVDHFAALTDLEAVLADGSIYRSMLCEAGGEALARVFRWGIGPYTNGLFTQSGFGIVTRASIALARRPERVAVFLFSLRDEAALAPAVARVRDILQRLPGVVGGVNLMNRRRVLAMAAPYPQDRLDRHGLIPQAVVDELGAQYQILPWTGFGTLYGSAAVMTAARREVRRALAGVGVRLIFLSPTRAAQLAALARWLPGRVGRGLASTAATLASSLELVAGRPNQTALPLCYWRNPREMGAGMLDPARDGCGLRWYSPLVPMRPQQVCDYVEMVERVGLEHGIEPLITLTSLNDRVFDSTVPLIFARDGVGAGERAACECYRAMLEAGRELGCFPYRMGVDGMAELDALLERSRVFGQRLRAALDPEGVIAPGRYEGG